MQKISDLSVTLGERAAALVAAASARAVTVCSAESCTGGKIAAAITAVPGASAVFPGSVVSYSNAIKNHLLGVSETTLSAFGAVSAETASEMAAGARRTLGADFAVSVTGLAGPGGGSAEKPVGLVYIGVASPDGVFASEHHFVGSREEIRLQASAAALETLRHAVECTGR